MGSSISLVLSWERLTLVNRRPTRWLQNHRHFGLLLALRLKDSVSALTTSLSEVMNSKNPYQEV